MGSRRLLLVGHDDEDVWRRLLPTIRN
eukprot:SAG31_NODE_19177_length_610_cov_0.804305_2_plen_26_part_01